MSITQILRYRKPVVLTLLIPLSLLLIDAHAFARSDEPSINLRNIKWELEGDTVVITYDLLAPLNQEYDVSVTLLNDNDPSFKVVPEAVTGDVGKGILSGVGRKILWEYKRDLPKGLEGDGYRFEIHAQPPAGGLPWFWIGVGFATAGGAAALLLGKKESGSASIQLPFPPGRP